jgi:hypothetical protein
MDLTIPVGAPSAPLEVNIGGTAYRVLLHDNLDGSFVLRLQAPDGTHSDLNLTVAQMDALHAKVAGVLSAKVKLNGFNPTPVAFRADTAAAIAGTQEEPFTLGNGFTLIVNPNGAGDDTVTFAASAGTSVSGASPSTDISSGPGAKFHISVDGSAAKEVTLTLAGLNTGAAIASAIQTAVRALEGTEFSAVACAYSNSVYTITSASGGTGSSVVITPGSSLDVSAALKLGKANGGTETQGTGDAVNIAAATAEEVAAAITAKATGWHATAADGAVTIFSEVEGIASSLVVNSSSTADEVLGITAGEYGAQGLGFDSDMADDGYQVLLTLNDTAKADHVTLSATDRTKSGFNIVADTDASEADVDVLVIGAVG